MKYEFKQQQKWLGVLGQYFRRVDGTIRYDHLVYTRARLMALELTRKINTEPSLSTVFFDHFANLNRADRHAAGRLTGNPAGTKDMAREVPEFRWANR